MDLDSPVKMMLPQEVKTPLVPDSEMHTENSTMFAGDKRKAGPDALSAPDETSSDASSEEDETPLDDYGFPVNDKDVLQDLLKGYSVRFFECDPRYVPVELVYDTTAELGFKPLEDRLADYYERGQPEYNKRLEEIKKDQLRCTGGKKYCGKLHVEVVLSERGDVAVGHYRSY